MELAVAVRIAAEFTGRMHRCVSPRLLERLLQVRHDPSADLKGLSRLVKMDPALCFMAMRLDRTLASHIPTAGFVDIDALVQRIGICGIDALTNQSAADLALQDIHRRQGLALAWLWRHALTTALLSRELSRELAILPQEEAYVAGLLVDLGKLALCVRTPPSCIPMLADSVQAAALLDAEARVVGADHGRIAAWLIRRYTGAWTAADAAEYVTADAPAMKNALPLTRLVWVASRLASGSTRGETGGVQAMAGLLEMDPQRLRRLAEETAAQTAALAGEIQISDEPPQGDRLHDARSTALALAVDAGVALSGVHGGLLTAAGGSATMRVLVRSLCVCLDVDALLVLVPEPHGGQLTGRFAAGRSFPHPVDRLQIPPDAVDCLPAVCRATGRIQSSFSRSRQERLTIIDHQLMAYLGSEGMVCAPFPAEDGREGGCLVLGVDSSVWPHVAQRQSLLADIAAAVGASRRRAGEADARTGGQAADRTGPDISRTRKIVHEINNPLGIIKNYLNVLIRRSGDHATGVEELRIINEELNRVTELIRSLTSPTPRSPANLEPVDANAVIEDIIELFRDSLPASAAIALHADLDAGLPMIVSDRNRLKQVLMNLLKNAMEAMPEGGTIQVRTRMQSGGGRVDAAVDSARRIGISVCDDGPGVDEAIKNDLFNPHVTSKAGHDGLGLTIVQEAVAYLKGTLSCESVPGRGTCFHIELPAGSSDS